MVLATQKDWAFYSNYASVSTAILLSQHGLWGGRAYTIISLSTENRFFSIQNILTTDPPSLTPPRSSTLTYPLKSIPK